MTPEEKMEALIAKANAGSKAQGDKIKNTVSKFASINSAIKNNAGKYAGGMVAGAAAGIGYGMMDDDTGKRGQSSYGDYAGYGGMAGVLATGIWSGKSLAQKGYKSASSSISKLFGKGDQ